MVIRSETGREESLPVLFWDMRKMRVGFYQYDPQFGEVAKNLDAVTAKLEQAEADLIVLPELFASGYQVVSQEEVQHLAEPVPDGQTTRRVVEIAKRRRMHIVAGLPEKAANGCYNSAVVVWRSRTCPKPHTSKQLTALS